MFKGLRFDCRDMDALPPSGGLVRSGHDPNNLVLSEHKGTQCSRCKVRRAKEYDAKGGVLHKGSAKVMGREGAGTK